MAYRTRGRAFVASAVAVGLIAATHGGHGGNLRATAATLTRDMQQATAGGAHPGKTPHGGNLSCSGLEALWESVGGSSSAAFMAAEIAKAESGGQQYATNTNGGASTDRGYWQVNSVHGALSTYDAAGNARAAVQISGNGRDWSAWVTYQTGAYQGQC